MRPLFFAEEIGSKVVLTGEEGHHAADVVRLKVGEEIDVSDNSRFVVARVVVVERGRVEAEILQELEIPKPHPHITIAQALIKGDALSESIDLMTQVGVHAIVPWVADRSIVQWDQEKAKKNRAKLQAVAKEASKQSRRPQIPEVREVATTTEILDSMSAFDRVILLHESGSQHLADERFGDERILMIVGPEGGLTDSELETLAGDVRRLGPTVIRSAQAGAIAAAVVFAASSWRG